MGWNGRRAGKERVLAWAFANQADARCSLLFVPSPGSDANYQTAGVSGMTRVSYTLPKKT